MPVDYHPLTHAERCQIHARLHRGWSKPEMARDLGRDPGTISRETSRHRGLRGDRHPQADGKATARRQEASAVPWKRTPERWVVAAGRLQEGWSPEQIAGWVRLPGEGMAGQEWIYPQVRTDRQAGGILYRCRRRRGQKPNGRGGRSAGRGHIPDWVDLAERPAVVEEQCRIGDWEREPIMGARHRGALVSAVDRGSKFRFLAWVEGKTAAAGHRGDHPAHGSGSGPGPHRHGGPRQGVRKAPGDRCGVGRRLLLRHSLPFLGTGPERAYQRPGAPVLPEGHRLPPGDRGTGAGGGGPAPPSASEGPGGSYPGRGLCPWSGSPLTRPTVPHRPGTPGPPVMHRSGFTRPSGPELAFALVNGFGQDRLESRWLPSGAEKKHSQRGFLGRRRDPSLRATPSFRDRGAVALRTGPGV